MKYMRRTVGYTGTVYKTNAQIVKELNITTILDKLLEYVQEKLDITCKQNAS
jgi:hypothetical protein